MIKLNSEYLVEVDPLNYTLKRDCKRKVVKIDKETGEEIEEDYFESIGYYRKLKNAIKGALEDLNNRKLSKGNHELLEAIEVINKNNEKFERIVKKIIKEGKQND